MSRSLWFAVLGAATAGAWIALLPARAASQEEPLKVQVTNFPEVQRVEGSISVEGTIRQAALVPIRDIEVRPRLRPEDTSHLVAAGTIATDGFGAVVLSLTGQFKGMNVTGGEVGAILIPDEEPVARAFEERGQIQFPMEVKAAPGLGPYFHSNQPRFIVGFPRYRVLLWNTSDRTVSVDLYAYLTNGS